MRKIKKLLMVLVGVVFLLTLSVAFAGDKNSNNQHKSTKSSKMTVSEKTTSKQMNQNQNQEMKQKQEMKEICFKAKNGEEYAWQNRYNKRLMKYDQKGNEEKMKKYLYRIAKRLGIEDPEYIEEFIQWAFQIRPWANDENNDENQH